MITVKSTLFLGIPRCDETTKQGSDSQNKVNDILDCKLWTGVWILLVRTNLHLIICYYVTKSGRHHWNDCIDLEIKDPSISTCAFFLINQELTCHLFRSNLYKFIFPSLLNANYPENVSFFNQTRILYFRQPTPICSVALKGFDWRRRTF